MSEIGGRIVGGLAEIEESGMGVGRGADVVVEEDEFVERSIVARSGGLDSAIAAASGFGRGVGIEGGMRKRVGAGPPADADDFMGIRVAGDFVVAGAFGRAAARKARDGMVKASPEKMHRAAFADKAAAKFLEDGVHGEKNAPEAARVGGIVARVRDVLVEPDGVGDFHGHGPNFYVDTDGSEDVHRLAVEPGDGAREEGDGLRLAPTGANVEAMREEIKFHFENAGAVGNRRSREAAGADVERNFPPMIDVRALVEADLADDLRPHVKSGAGVFPFGIGKCGPGFADGRVLQGWGCHAGLHEWAERSDGSARR